MNKNYIYGGLAALGIIALLASCGDSNNPAQPVAGGVSGAPVVVNTPAASSGSDGFLTGLLMGHLFSSGPSREVVNNRTYYNSVPRTVTPSTPTPSVTPGSTAPRTSVPSVAPKPAPSLSGSMRSFSGSSSSYRPSSSFSSSRSFSGGFRGR